MERRITAKEIKKKRDCLDWMTVESSVWKATRPGGSQRKRNVFCILCLFLSTNTFVYILKRKFKYEIESLFLIIKLNLFFIWKKMKSRVQGIFTLSIKISTSLVDDFDIYLERTTPSNLVLNQLMASSLVTRWLGPTRPAQCFLRETRFPGRPRTTKKSIP